MDDGLQRLGPWPQWVAQQPNVFFSGDTLQRESLCSECAMHFFVATVLLPLGDIPGVYEGTLGYVGGENKGYLERKHQHDVSDTQVSGVPTPG